MSIVDSHHPVTKEICEALGIKRAIDFKLIMKLGEKVRVETTFLPDEDQLKKMVPVLKKYRLEEEEIE